MEIKLSEDRQTVSLVKDGQTLTMTGLEYRQILNEAPALWNAGLPIPAVPAQPEPIGLLESNGALRLPGMATHPEQAGAGVIVHNRLFGHFVVPLQPMECREWGKWLLGSHPNQAPRPDTPPH